MLLPSSLAIHRWPFVVFTIQKLEDLDLVMSGVERKGFEPNLDQAYGNGPVAATTLGQYDSAEDVFGNEEGAQVCVFFAILDLLGRS